MVCLMIGESRSLANETDQWAEVDFVKPPPCPLENWPRQGREKVIFSQMILCQENMTMLLAVLFSKKNTKNAQGSPDRQIQRALFSKGRISHTSSMPPQ